MSLKLRGRLALLMLSGVMAVAAPLKITHPAKSEVVSGTYQITVDASGYPQAAAVEYRSGSLVLGVSTATPYSFSWNTAYVSDGNYSLRATVFDAAGNVLAAEDTDLSIKNRDCSIAVNSPDLEKTASGTISLNVTAQDPKYYPARWSVFVDGALVRVGWTDNAGSNKSTVSLLVDTTRFTNGEHELHLEIATDLWQSNQQQKTWQANRLGINRIFTINNGRVLMAVGGNFQHLYLQPGQSALLTCRAYFSDNSTGSCGSASYTTSDPKIAAVDANGKLIGGGGDGFATVTLTSAGKSSKIYVWVKRTLNIAHFSGDGRVLNAYSAGESIFPVAPFDLTPSDLQASSALDGAVRQAGINTLYSGFYLNPRNASTNYKNWAAGYDSLRGTSWKWAAAHGYHLYTMGDEIARNIGGEAWWTLNWPSAKQAVQHAMESLASSKVAIGVDVIDEGSMLWGATPTPGRFIGETGMFDSVICQASKCSVHWTSHPISPGRFFAGTQFAMTGSKTPGLNTPLGKMFQASNITANSFDFVPSSPVNGTFTKTNDPGLEFLWWAGSAGLCPQAPCNPPVANTALSDIASWLRTASAHVPVSWPALGIAPPVVHSMWAGRNSNVSDFMSHYWDSMQAGQTYSWSSGILERTYWMREAYYARQPYVWLDRPQVILDSISSYYYFKRESASAYYTPPADELISAGTSGRAAFAGMLTAAAIGNAGVRLYKFEQNVRETYRKQVVTGVRMQTGANPFINDAKSREIWKAMGYAANLLTKTLQPFLLGSALPSPGLSENIVTAARRSGDGVMLLAINTNDWNRQLSIDLSAYRSGTSITRYLGGARGLRTELLPDRTSDNVSLEPGDAVIYLFPKSAATRYLTTVRLAAPALPKGASKAILHKTYVYPENLDAEFNGTDCTNGCDLAVDKSIGELFYQFLFLNSDGGVAKRGPVSNSLP